MAELIDTYAIILLQQFRNPFFDFIAVFMSFAFSTAIVAGVFSFFMIVYYLKKSMKSFFVSMAALATAFIVAVLKRIIARPRPDYALQIGAIPFSRYSFPSGHTTVAFLLAILLSRYYPKYTGVFYSVAVLVGLSRIYLGVHYLSDVVGGAVLGLAIGWLFLRKEKEIFGIGEKIIKLIPSF